MSEPVNTTATVPNSPPVQTQESEEHNVYVLFQQQNTGPWKYFIVSNPAKALISDIKNNLASEWSVPPQCQRLFLNTTELADDKRSIGSYLSPTDIYVTMTPTDDYTPPQEDDKEPPQNQQSYGGLVYGPSFITNDVSGSFRRRLANSDDSDNEWDFFERRPSHGLVGLKNQGATCYLNSLIQVFYMTPEFRKMIFCFERPWDQLLVSKEKDSEKKAEGRQVATTAATKPAEKSDKSKDIILQMQLLFARMQYSPVGAVSTSGLTTSFGWDNSEVFVQHDVQELNRVLCDKLEEKMKDKLKPTDHSITKLYKGSMLNMVKCTNCGRISTREEDFYDMSLPIKGKKSILDSLEEFVEVEVMKEDNAYFCEKCQSKQTAEKSVRFKNYPPLINIQLKRFEYDWERDMRVKIHDEIAFPNILNMEPYLVEESLRDKKEKDDKKANNNNAIPEEDSFYYELYGVAIHSGNAGFGHYYAFIKNFTDGAWYKFNDEHVTPADESDVLSGSEKPQPSFSWVSSAMMQRSATPYMLVYRRRAVKEISKETGKPILEEFKLPPVLDSEIPAPVVNYLSELQKRKEKKKQEREKERNSANITVFRNKLDLPVKYIKVDRSFTLKQLKEEVIKLVQSETTTPTYYRFRRIANRKNNTKRPMNLYKDEDMEKTLGDLMLDKKQMIYLEQDTDPSFPGLDDKGDDESFVSFRMWSPALKKPTSLRDYWIPKSWTLTQVKGFLEKETNIPASSMVLVEEETEKQLNLMLVEDQLISKYGIISGDIIHVEQLTPEHCADATKPGKVSTSFTEQYFTEKHNELVVEFEETEKSFKRRVAKDKKEAAPVVEEKKDDKEKVEEAKEGEKKDEKKDWKTNKISFKLATNKNHSLQQLKDIVGIKTGIEPRRLRIYAKDSYHDGRLLKDLQGKLGKLLLRFSSKLTTELGIEILDHPEDLIKGDKLIQTRYHNASGDFVCFFEVKVNKVETIRNFKEKLSNLTGVSPDAQIISEWYSERFYKLFQNDSETIQQARIRKMDVLRMDQLKDPKLNLAENNAPFQLVQFIAWESTPFGRKEMQTSFPIMLTISENGTLFDLRKAVAEKVNLHYRNINIAFTSSFPILEGRISPIRDICKAHAPPELVVEPAPAPTADPSATTPAETTPADRKSVV